MAGRRIATFQERERLFSQELILMRFCLGVRRRGREALLSFRMNDDHGLNFLRTKFWRTIRHGAWVKGPRLRPSGGPRLHSRVNR